MCRQLNIKFQADFQKLYKQTSAHLLAVREIRIDDDTPKELIEYDTTQCNGNLYPLPRGKCLQLIFIGNLHIPFCTIRCYTEEKTDYYKRNIGKIFEIMIGNWQ